MTADPIPPVLIIDGKDYRVVHAFGTERALIDYDGEGVFVDWLGDEWDLSGRPAAVNSDEMAALKAFDGPDGTTVDIVPES